MGAKPQFRPNVGSELSNTRSYSTVSGLLPSGRSMEAEPANKMIREIDESGFPLQRYCAAVLHNLGWSVLEEIPVSIPNLGNNSVTQTIETTGDIHALGRIIGRNAFNLIIECKRRQGKSWVFFRQLSKVKDDAIFLPELQDSTRRPIQYCVSIPGNLLAPAFPICSIGWEVGLKADKEPSEKKAPKNVVREAALQVWTATLATLLSSKKEMIEEANLGYDDGIDHSIYIPVVVTGAEIYDANLELENYKIGQLGGDVRKLEYAILRANIPKHLIFDLESPLPPGTDRSALQPVDIFVVNYSAFKGFVEKLEKSLIRVSVTDF